MCQILKTGIILLLFKGKGAKTKNKDNYRGITLFPTISKIYEMILVNRLEHKKEWDVLKHLSVISNVEIA